MLFNRKTEGFSLPCLNSVTVKLSATSLESSLSISPTWYSGSRSAPPPPPWIYSLMETSIGGLSSHQYSASITSLVASQREVTYSCGSCGFDLNLNSSSRNTSTIGSKYGKSMKKGIISFFSIDDSRFNQVEEFNCVPYFISKHSLGLFHKRIKLLCRKCGNYIGIATDLNAFSPHLITNGSDSPSSSEILNLRKYDIRICSLQPSSADVGTPFVS